MKVIFLDIDGVLNYKKCPWLWSRNTGESYLPKKGDTTGGVLGIDPAKVKLLNKVLIETQAKIVLSSTWRSEEFWLEILVVNGIPESVILDRTPDLSLKCSEINALRGKEVEKWLAESGHAVRKYAILDDNSDFSPEQQDNFFKTDWEVGLTEEHADKLIKHFYENEPCQSPL